MTGTTEIITITGCIGSGKSVVGRALAARLGYDYYSTGSIQRAIAEKRGMSTLELNAHSEAHPEIDYEIDRHSAELGRSRDKFILDSRLAWYFIPHSFKVYLAVDARIAAKRILEDRGRTGESYPDLGQAYHDILERRQCELSRFESLYRLDCDNRAQFDLVIDTSGIPPETVTDRIAAVFEQWRDRANKS